MPNSSRPNPTIPDHDVLRKIGGGAYGEVWLARGVTGALRAVKVVWREDFEDERGFEREFEGILKFEPISRDHPALVNILHVGRSPDGVSFYYYVMELGDDVRAGQDINPIEYEPRTLRADTQQAAGTQWDTGVCIDVGLRLSEALNHLHERGLAHRDVKPSNVIFVNGRAKLADIGLVAARGQRTFVGTEGFVPPEGPGSTQADVYSLGKVLYEIATGKDRLDFPELPDELPVGRDRKRWLELNRIICDICEPRISKRKISTAAELAEALRRLQRGKRRRSSGAAVWLTTLLLLGFAGWASWEAVKDSEWARLWQAPAPAPPVPMGLVKVTSDPPGAEVIAPDGTKLGVTPTEIRQQVGSEVAFTLRLNNYYPLEVREFVPAESVGEPLLISRLLRVFSPPLTDAEWIDHLGYKFLPVGEEHVSSGFVSSAAWKIFSESPAGEGKAAEFLTVTQNGEPAEVVLAPLKGAMAFCEWFRAEAFRNGHLTEDHEALPLQEMSFEHPGLSERARKNLFKPFRVIVREISYGGIRVVSQPEGAEVIVNERVAGSTQGPLLIQKLKPGEVDLLLVLDGYKPLSLKRTVTAGEVLEVAVTLEESQGAVFGRPWENGLGMRFEPVGADLLAAVWETRVQDYELFLEESGHTRPRPPDFEQGPDHPVVYVSRDDAAAFCQWLTVRERRNERIGITHFYRLPTDLEWSRMAGLQEDPLLSPGARDAIKPRKFPWGPEFPVGRAVGNFADITASMTPGIPSDRTIPNYEDGFAHTAPVGEFPANLYGLHDLSGNVEEWVQDDYSSLYKEGVLRGGGWNTYQKDNLYTGWRNGVPPTTVGPSYGFRIVLSKTPPRREGPDVLEEDVASPYGSPQTPSPDPTHDG
jgi:eukaryotic-like serine/threonine-protein kinase